MTDLISRRAAIDAIDKNREALLSSGMTGAEHILVHYGRRVIEELHKDGCEYWDDESGFCALQRPAATGKRGKWESNEYLYTTRQTRCSECKTEFYVDDLLNVGEGAQEYLPNYCPHCGAKMGDGWEEPEINPCRGCDDYDGRGGCKSHGGCGAERSEDG